MITTLNLSVFLIDFVKTIVEDLDISVKEFILVCLKRKIDDLCSEDYSYFNSAVEYQPAGGCYVRVKVGFSWADYDSFLLCRFFWKCSVSRFAAVAVHDYYEEVARELKGDSTVKVSDNSQGLTIYMNKYIYTEEGEVSMIVEEYRVNRKRRRKQRGGEQKETGT